MILTESMFTALYNDKFPKRKIVNKVFNATTLLETWIGNTCAQHWRKLRHTCLMVMAFTNQLEKNGYSSAPTGNFPLPSPVFFNAAAFWVQFTRIGWVCKCTSINPELGSSVSLTAEEKSSYTLYLVCKFSVHKIHCIYCAFHTPYSLMPRILCPPCSNSKWGSIQGTDPRDSLMVKHLAWHNYFHTI